MMRTAPRSVKTVVLASKQASTTALAICRRGAQTSSSALASFFTIAASTPSVGHMRVLMSE